MSIDDALKRVLVESQELVYPKDLIERNPNPDFTFVFGKVRKIHAICGLRRVGKTYYLYQIRKKLIEHGIPKENTFYINMEDERIMRSTETLTRLIPAIKELYKIKGNVYLFIDEIHQIPNWSAWVRRIHDNRKAILFISGSTSKLSSDNIPRELRGRSLSVQLLPLPFKDFLKFKGAKINSEYLEWSDEQLGVLKNYINEYIRYGGLPEVVLTPEYKKLLIVQDYFRTIILRDIVEQFNVENKVALEETLKLLINTPTLSITKVYNILKSTGHKVGKETIKNYVNYAEKAFFIDQVYIHSPKIKDQMMYPRKIYLADNAFITSLSIKYDYGRLLENLVYIELKRKIRNNPLTKIHYWKSRDGSEVDFVVVEKGKVTRLIQVTWDPSDYNVKYREIRSIIKAGKELGVNKGIVITYDYKGIEKINGFKIEFIPIWMILMNLKKIL